MTFVYEVDRDSQVRLRGYPVLQSIDTTLIRNENSRLDFTKNNGRRWRHRRRSNIRSAGSSPLLSKPYTPIHSD